MAERTLNKLTITPTSGEQLRPTVELLFRRLGAELCERQTEATLADIQAGAISPAGFLRAELNGELLGAVGLQLQPGRVATLTPPQAVDDRSEAAAPARQQLLRAASELALRGGANLLQALLLTDTGPDADQLRDAGFERIADLLYLVSGASSFPHHRPQGPDDFQLLPIAAADRPRLAKLIERTYQQTRDCPSLNGARDAADVLAGYEAIGDSGSDHWQIARGAGEDVGCLIFAEHRALKICEIVYMGVVPEARGRSLGLVLTHEAQHLARHLGAERLVLAVDADNAPAIRAYAAAGFTGWDRRSVFVKRL